MFGAFFSSILGKVSAGLLLVAVCALGYFYVDNLHKDKDLADANTKITAQTAKITDLNGTVDNLNKQLKAQADLAAASDKARANTQAANDNLDKKDQTVSQRTKSTITQIEKKYEALPQTPANVAQKNDEVTRTRLTMLADVFCNSYPNDVSCSGGGAASAPQAASAASH